MSRKPYKKIFFNDKKKLDLLLDLRRQGWSYFSIAFIFGVDHSSIYHECKKFSVEKNHETIDFSVRTILHNLDIKVPKVKMYKDYLRDAGYRYIPRIYSE